MKFIQQGAAIDYTPAADVAAGTVVVLEDLVGVATRSILAGQTGVIHVEGVFEFPKEVGAGKAIPFGKLVYWHLVAGEVRTSASGGKLLGKTVQATGDNDAMVRVRLGQG